jgi:hypothetical protein
MCLFLFWVSVNTPQVCNSNKHFFYWSYNTADLQPIHTAGKRIHQIVKEPRIFVKRHLNKIFILYANLIKRIVAITSAHKHDQQHRGRLYYRRINRMSRLFPQTERCKYIESLHAYSYVILDFFLLILFCFYRFYGIIILYIHRHIFYILTVIYTQFSTQDYAILL